MGIWIQVFGLVCVLVTYVKGTEVLIRMPQVTPSHEGTCGFPDTISIELLWPGSKTEWVIQLTRDYVIPTERSVYLMTDTRVIEEFKVDSDQHEGAQAYHNHRHGAAFVVKCARTQERRLVFQLEGSIFLGEHKQRVIPSTTWRQRAVVNQSHVTSPYTMTEITEFKAADSAAKFPPITDYTRDIAHREHWSSRYKRDVALPATYSIDVLPVVDNTLYSWFLSGNSGNRNQTISKILDYLGSLFTSVSMRLDTLSLQNRTLKLRMLPPVLLMDKNQVPYNPTDLVLDNGSYKINATLLLERFKNWLIRSTNLGTYDHAMFITALDIYGGSDSGIKFNITKGLAYVGAVCKTNGESSSILEDKGAYQSEGVAAHEIGHGLGSQHDGQQNLCSSADRYIMSDATYPDTDDNVLNPWRFSSCSSTYILTKLKQLERDTQLLQRCLLSATGSVTSNDLTISADTQCKLFYGNESYICRGSSLPSLDTMCDEFYCYVPGTNNICERMTAATGTCCGSQKKCFGGQCTDADQGQCPWSEVCPLGDQGGIIIDGKTCAQLTNTYCYIMDVNVRCCDTCKKFVSDTTGCTYGDKQLGCVDDDCGSIFTEGPYKGLPYDFPCCSTCRQQCIDTGNIIVTAGVYSCKDYILNQGNNQACYRNDVLQDVCCKSCEAARDKTNDDCPWGDRSNCSVLLRRPVGYICTSSQLKLCCHTCSVLSSRIATTTTATTAIKTSPTTVKTSTTTKSSIAATTKKSAATTKTPSTTKTSLSTSKSTSSITKINTSSKPPTSAAATNTLTPEKTETSKQVRSVTPCDSSRNPTCGASNNHIATTLLYSLSLVYICLMVWQS